MNPNQKKDTTMEKSQLTAFLRDEEGEIIDKIALIGAIAVPLFVVLYLFADEIMSIFNDNSAQVQSLPMGG